MMVNTAVIASLLVMAQSTAANGEDRLVKVLRHHPGIIDNLEARKHDANLILKQWDKKTDRWRGPGILTVSHDGGLGSGYTLSISRNAIPAWKKMIDHLHKKKRFQYYTPYKPDKHGYGLLPLPKKARKCHSTSNNAQPERTGNGLLTSGWKSRLGNS